MVDILLTNDDGYKSVGFIPLLKELSKDFSVLAIAPSEKKSWTGKSITKEKTLTLKKIKKYGFDIFLLDGTPADCVQVGVNNILRKYPKMVVSGINNAPNVGIARFLSSGTVGAAMEASLCGIKAAAFSYCPYLSMYRKTKNPPDLFNSKNYYIFEDAVKITARIIKALIKKDFKDIDLFSINIPLGATINSGIKFTKLFRDSKWHLFQKENNKFLHYSPFVERKDLKQNTDLESLDEGKISITPISLSLTSEKLLKRTELLIKKI